MSPLRTLSLLSAGPLVAAACSTTAPAPAVDDQDALAEAALAEAGALGLPPDLASGPDALAARPEPTRWRARSPRSAAAPRSPSAPR